MRYGQIRPGSDPRLFAALRPFAEFAPGPTLRYRPDVSASSNDTPSPEPASSPASVSANSPAKPGKGSRPVPVVTLILMLVAAVVGFLGHQAFQAVTGRSPGVLQKRVEQQDLEIATLNAALTTAGETREVDEQRINALKRENSDLTDSFIEFRERVGILQSENIRLSELIEKSLPKAGDRYDSGIDMEEVIAMNQCLAAIEQDLPPESLQVLRSLQAYEDLKFIIQWRKLPTHQ